MERLTKRDAFGWIAHDCEEHFDEQPDGTALSFCIGEAIDRLAAYEDTGLTPAEIADLKDGICMGCSVPAIVSEQQHIQDLLDAEKAERLVVLPCKVGDEVFFRLENGEVHKERVQGISMSASCDDTILRFGGYPEAEYAWGGAVGKTIFLTRQEAEEVLGKEENENG